MQYGLNTLYLFSVYQTREEYRTAIGKDAPPFDPAKPIKSWFDPKAGENARRKLVYENVLAIADNGAPLVDEKGKPFLEPLLIDREDAAAVNIPVKDFTGKIQEQPTSTREVPVPMRALTENEELVLGLMGLVSVRNKAALDEQTTGFTLHDRAMLQAIAVKLGVK